MTINVGGPEQGLVGDLGKLFMLKLSHIVHHYSQVFALKTQPEICFMDINKWELWLAFMYIKFGKEKVGDDDHEKWSLTLSCWQMFLLPLRCLASRSHIPWSHKTPHPTSQSPWLWKHIHPCSCRQCKCWSLHGPTLRHSLCQSQRLHLWSIVFEFENFVIDNSAVISYPTYRWSRPRPQLLVLQIFQSDSSVVLEGAAKSLKRKDIKIACYMIMLGLIFFSDQSDNRFFIT